MSLQKELGLDEANEQQQLPLVRVCWDDLFTFLRKMFRSKLARPRTILANLDAETSTEYKLIIDYAVPHDFELDLQEISLYSSRPNTSQWGLAIADQSQFAGKKIYVSLTLPYSGVIIHTDQKIQLAVKTDGVATDLAATLVGKENYLGGK